jgi:Tfp pilus assembly protein PilX
MKMLSSRGAALITSLIILAVLALLGVSTMTATTTELQIANDMEAEARSFQAAEAGLTAAAHMVLDGVLSPDTDVGAIDFSSFTPNPLADMGSDLPVVTIPAAPVEDGGCARSPNASSADQILCSSFVLVSTHRSASAGKARAGASTMLMLGLSREETSPN